MRHQFVSDVVKELLGPRGGAEEVFSSVDEPRNEYSTGQLFPSQGGNARSPDQEEALAEDASSGDDESNDGGVTLVNQAFIDAGQNFRRVPTSLGISFVLARAPSDGDISVCVTWGRYREVEGQGWVRTPHHWIQRVEGDVFIDGVPSNDGSLRLVCKASKVDGGKYKVSIYVSSEIVSVREGRPGNEEIIFQPEIRVRIAEAGMLRELGDLSFSSEDPEWRVSTRQYDRMQVYARGHLCGAYWREIDPQRIEGRPESVTADLPFVWVDGQHFLASEPRIQEFLVPDLRSEFIPMYPAPASGSSYRIDLLADRLADSSSFQDVERQVGPLITAYEEWVTSIPIDPAHRAIDEEIVKRHRDAIRRVRQGIDFLRNDRDALMSFLFMNKAMAKQYAWGRPPEERAMKWRPFQLAFILLSMESSVRETAERQICDTIWFPTGGGKTEAYLGLAAFVMAYRRRSSGIDEDGSCGGEGTAVISRYTLRLLTIQQFRRALKMIMACELLRCTSSTADGAGWLPPGWVRDEGLIWGRSPFSLGLWVGGAVTPNHMKGTGYGDFGAGAINLLERPSQNDESDPAQILNCPACNSILSIPLGDIPTGTLSLKMHVGTRPRSDQAALDAASNAKFRITGVRYVPHMSGRSGFANVEIQLGSSVRATEIHNWWIETAEPALGTSLNSFGVTRPGYIPIAGGRQGKASDYEIRCPDPDCELNQVLFQEKLPARNGGWDFVAGHPCFVLPTNSNVTRGLNISAFTVDQKILGRPPSMLIATVDKLARLAFTNEAASLFGRVRSFDTGVGMKFSQEMPSRNRVAVSNFDPPSLIIQDELHLLDGPLGSTFGLFETAVGQLCGRPKYIASSATIRNSVEQVECLMGRSSRVFPPVNPDITRGFFLSSNEVHPLNEAGAGRMFLGFAFPGRAPQTPMLRLWGRLLQTAQNFRDQIQAMPDGPAKDERIADLDHYWTLIGYFNAVRELAQGESLIRQDIPQFLDKLHRQNPATTKRPELGEGFRNLSSQTSSSELPGILAKMERAITDGDPLSAVASTSMFGTGVDVSRLSLMIIHGQPKSASQYIQAVGRIGRRRSGLAVVFFRVSKPRDLNHYEYFTGYHRKLPVAVEPISVKPLAPKSIERAVGPLVAVLLRNWQGDNPVVPNGIDENEGAGRITEVSQAVIEEVIKVFEEKWDSQSESRRRDREGFIDFVRSQIERWQEYARREREAGRDLLYSSNAGVPVVLGQDENFPSVFQNVSQSLREVESTIKIFTGND